jgi:hypothetical protein
MVRQTFQALGAEHAIMMLGNAFTAKVSLAIQATHHSFAALMMVTSLVGKIFHMLCPNGVQKIWSSDLYTLAPQGFSSFLPSFLCNYGVRAVGW